MKEYNKLIRDKIPQIIEDSGSKCIVEKLSSEGYIKHLNLKLEEELSEYLASESVEELADLVEVIYAILEFKNISKDEFEKIRQDKVEKRGTFKNRLLLKGVMKD